MPPPEPADSIELTTHCLLRLVTALAIEAADIPHLQGSATEELNQRSGRQFTAEQWLAILDPAWVRQFEGGGRAPPSSVHP